MPITLMCKTCGKQFSVPPSHSKQQYCSSVCYGISQRGRSVCKIDGCKNIVLGHGLCNRHYLRFKRTGSPTGSKPRTGRPKKSRQNIVKTCKYCGKNINNPTVKIKYCSSHCRGMSARKPYVFKSGYKLILIPTHPRADAHGYVREHILVIEAKIGRSLRGKEVCHHIDGNKMNNDPNNLEIFDNNSL